MLRTIRPFRAAALSLLLVAACHNDEVFLTTTVVVDPMFERYVSMGNSITAGFQSGGINENTQGQSYAVLLANAMRTPIFNVPLMNTPGCPALYDTVFTQHRTSTNPCAFRKTQPTPVRYINNVAVPGAEVMDAIANTDSASNSNALTMFFLGGLTQMQMLYAVQPTFVSVWIGNNDVLGAATSQTNAGDTTKITPVAAFTTRYGMMLDSITAAGPQGVVLIGVANVTGIPYLSRGSTYFAIKAGLVPGAVFPPAMTVSLNCAPPRGDSVLVPFPYGGALLAAAAAGAPRNLDCADTVAAVIVPSELVRLAGAVAGYNVYISAQAAARGWAYLDPNTTLDSLRAIPAQVAPFPTFTVIVNGQPKPAPCTVNPFGLAFSCDAVHPSANTHKLIARHLRDVINTKYGTSLPAIP